MPTRFSLMEGHLHLPLAQRLVDLLTYSQLRAGMAKTNLRAAAPFSWDVGAQRLIELYNDIQRRHNLVPEKGGAFDPQYGRTGNPE